MLSFLENLQFWKLLFSVSSSSGTDRLGPLNEIFLLEQKVITEQYCCAPNCGDDRLSVVIPSWMFVRLSRLSACCLSSLAQCRRPNRLWCSCNFCLTKSSFRTSWRHVRSLPLSSPHIYVELNSVRLVSLICYSSAANHSGNASMVGCTMLEML